MSTTTTTAAAPQIAFTRVSRNKKTGPIPVTTSSAETCPDACPLKARLLASGARELGGCYADSGPLALFWRKVTERKAGLAWQEALDQIRALPKGTLWRHNQSGDLAGAGDQISFSALDQLVQANRGKRGFTYTHKPVDGMAEQLAILQANKAGFTINLSANTLAEADSLSDLQIAPVVVVLPADQTRATTTPAGRKVAICPAVISENIDCARCGLCALRDRKAIIGFPAHGAAKRKAETVALGGSLEVAA